MRLMFFIAAVLLTLVLIVERIYYAPEANEKTCLEAFIQCHSRSGPSSELDGVDNARWYSFVDDVLSTGRSVAVERNGKAPVSISEAPWFVGSYLDPLWEMRRMSTGLRATVGSALYARSAAAWTGNMFCNPHLQ